MNHDLNDILKQQGAPPRQFWENELEIHTMDVLAQAIQPGAAEVWLAKRTQRQKKVLCWNLARRGMALGQPGGDYQVLVPYFFLEAFLKFKSKDAVADHARRVLPHSLLLQCEKTKGDYDPLALCFAIYGEDPEQLPFLFCLDKVYKRGFTRLRLVGNVRRPKQEFAEFLSPPVVTRLLRELDDPHRDYSAGDLRRISVQEDHQIVFIRRPHRPGQLMRETKVLHGYRLDWNVLDFSESAKRVHIAADSIRKPVALADRIASEYFGAPCEYQEERLVTYRNQLITFLRLLQAERCDQLQLAGLVVGHCCLAGKPRLQISDSRSISAAIAHFESAIGGVLDDIKQIANIKVRYRDKELILVFDRLAGSDDEFVVRYSDRHLKPQDRRDFEAYLEQHHGIGVISTRKRFAA